MSRYLSKAKSLNSGEWVQGCYFTYYILSNDGRKLWTDDICSEDGEGIQIDNKTLCQCAKLNQHGKLWEGDYFWEETDYEIIGVIEWGDYYDGWVVNLIPNVVKGSTIPDFNTIIETFRLEDYCENDYKSIFDNLIGNKHDYEKYEL